MCLSQVACGTYIPSQRDWPNSETKDVERMNRTLVRSIVCELSYAVTLAVENDLELARKRPSRRAYSSYLVNWGVEVATDLTVSESSTLNPSGLWAPMSPLSPVFTLGGGISGASVATNDNTFNVFYPLSALYKPDLFRTNNQERPCRHPSTGQQGSPLVDIDLKILPLLETRIQLVTVGLADNPDDDKNAIAGEKNVLTQTVSIKETVSGDITPTWKFSTGSVNPSGLFFNANRERTHQVVFTFGRLARGGQSLSPLAQAFHVNEQLRAGLRNSRIRP
ncbi:hypothetical protein BSZ19_19850 [Bradyrhizobium japonicum]|uniref:Uncharacterized protein n=2 Tax=Bradyrhizobium japonicum TaxID=375 RepID=A0A1Y2JMY8_BRAJP|nr:hypothetical protein BSZ19_19850 [Bradyrhizobium japonicum]